MLGTTLIPLHTLPNKPYEARIHPSVFRHKEAKLEKLWRVIQLIADRPRTIAQANLLQKRHPQGNVT